MRKEQINDKEGICLLTIFVTGSTLIIGIGSEAKNDAWIAGITGILMSVPMLLVYSRILSLFHGNCLFEILDITMGKVLGKISSVLYIWYAFHLGSLVIRNFGEFLGTVAMRETPMLVSVLILVLCCVICVRNGVEVMARTASSLLPIFITIIVIVQLLAIPKLEICNLKPVLGGGLVPVLKGGFYAFSFPFAEAVLMMGTLYTLQKKKSHYKVYIYGILIAGTTIILLTIRNIMILGFMRDRLYFTSHTAVAMISIGDFLQRIEVTVAFTFAVGVFIKTSVCLFVTCRGISRLLSIDYRSIVIQTGLLMAFFAYIVYESTMEMFDWAMKVYPYYALPFQVILPLIIWFLAEIKAKKMKPQMSGQTN